MTLVLKLRTAFLPESELRVRVKRVERIGIEVKVVAIVHRMYTWMPMAGLRYMIGRSLKG